MEQERQELITVELQIGGQKFQFTCTPENQKNLLNAAAYLDSAISDLRNTFSQTTLSLEKAAVMAALNFAVEILDGQLEREQSMQQNRERFSRMIRDIETVLVA